MGPGWGWCMAGKWSKAGKGKNKTFHFGIWIPSLQQAGQVEALLIHRTQPSLAMSLTTQVIMARQCSQYLPPEGKGGTR